MTQYPKVQYLYSKLMENTESMISRTFQKILSVEFMSKTISFDGKTPYEQELLRELLKQLHSYAVKVAMAEVAKINEKHKIASVAEINAELHFRKKVLKEIGHEQEWTNPEFDEEKLFLETLQSELNQKLRILKDQHQLISQQFSPTK